MFSVCEKKGCWVLLLIVLFCVLNICYSMVFPNMLLNPCHITSVKKNMTLVKFHDSSTTFLRSRTSSTTKILQLQLFALLYKHVVSFHLRHGRRATTSIFRSLWIYSLACTYVTFARTMGDDINGLSFADVVNDFLSPASTATTFTPVGFASTTIIQLPRCRPSYYN